MPRFGRCWAGYFFADMLPGRSVRVSGLTRTAIAEMGFRSPTF